MPITTRSEYMQAMTAVGHPDTPERKIARQAIHHNYYLQFRSHELKSLILNTFGIETLMASYAKDEHFNSSHTPLVQWDQLFGSFQSCVDKSLLKKTGEGMSLSTCVCTCKAVARSLIEHPPEIPRRQTKEYSSEWIEGRRSFRLVTVCELTLTSSTGCFSITSNLFEGSKREASGMLDDLIEEHLPEVALLLKWSFYSREKDGWSPLLANTIYLAGNRDCHGLGEGEIMYGSATAHAIGGIPAKADWCEQYRRPDAAIPLDMIDPNYVGSIESVLLERIVRRGTGKDRELDAARRTAIWLEATDEELMAPDLEQRLLDRLPGLFVEFTAAMTDLGFKL